MLKLIISRAGYGKTTYIQNKIKECVEKGEQSVLIIPEQISFESERDILKKVGAENLKFVSVMSFTRLCSLFFAKYGKREKPYIDAIGKTALMEETLKKLTSSLNLFKRSAQSSSFCELMIELDNNCKKNSINPEKLMLLSDGNEGVLKEKLFETSMILSEYQNELNNEFFDPLDDLSVVTQKVGDTDFFENKTVFIDSFTGFTLQQLELIKKIILTAKDTYISLGFDDVYSENCLSVFQNMAKSAKELQQYANENCVEFSKEVIIGENNRFQNDELKFLEKNIFSNEGNVFDGSVNNIFLVSVDNIYEEAQYVAKKIVELVKTDNLRYREIAVISRDAGSYNGIIDEVFEKYNIPVFVDNRETVENFSLFKLAIFSLSASIENFDFDDIMSIVKTGIIGVDNTIASLFELYCVVWQIRGKGFLNEFTFSVDSFVKGDEEFCENALEKIEELRKKIIQPLVIFKKECKDTAESYIKALYNLIKNYNCAENLKASSKIIEEKGYLRLSENTARSYDILIHILDQLYLSLGDRQMTLKRFYEIFVSSIANLDVGSLPQGLDAVSVGSAERMRPKDPKVTFIVGANEGVFPSFKQGSGLFSDAELKKLKDKGVNLPFFDIDTAIDEQYLAYCAVCSPSQKLFVSYSLSDFGNGSLEGSEIVTEIQSLFPKIETEKFDNSKIISVDDALRQYAVSKGNDKEIEKYFENNPDLRFDFLKQALSSKVTNMTEETANKLYSSYFNTSASKVEEYYSCPFMYFCKRGLDAYKIRENEIDSLNKGTIVHYIIEKMVEKFSVEEYFSLEKEKIGAEITALFDEITDEMLQGRELTSTEKFQNRKLKEMVVDLIDRVFREISQSEFTPVATELSIGIDKQDGKEKLKPLIYKFDDRTVKITGFVDRVDTFSSGEKKYIRIIDYKTGKISLDLKKILAGNNLQMPLYMKAVVENGKEKFGECIPAGMLYFLAQDTVVDADENDTDEDILKKRLMNLKLQGMFLDDLESAAAMEPAKNSIFTSIVYNKDESIRASDKKYTNEEYETLSKYVEYLLDKYSKEVLSGNVLPNPTTEKKKVCDYCEYKEICGFDKKDMEKEEDVKVSAYFKMKEIMEKEESK